MELATGSQHARVFEYDALRHRLWIWGQRCHHGATGAVVASTACVGLVAGQQRAAQRARSMLALVLAGGAMMLHDWKDRSIWFERGHGSQP